MILTPSQNKIAGSRARFRVINAGRRFGKTVLAVEEMKGLALAKESKIAYIAPTYGQARDICWEILKRELLPITKKVNESRLELEVMTKEGKSSFISLRGWESVETMRGQSYDLLILDEVASMRNFLTGWDEVLSPTLVDRKGQAMFISTPKGFNHFYDLYNLHQKDPNYESFHFTTYDNPNIPVEEIEREKLSKPENTFAQEYLADFRKQEGLVYKEFSRDLHIYSDTSERQPRNIINTIAGVDFGFTNPTAVISILKDFDGTYWVNKEYYKRGKTDTQIAEYVKACNFNEVYPDPESPSAIQQMSNLGVNCKEVIKNKDSIKNGIDKIRALFLKRKLFIHISCVNLIQELETYAYAEKKPDRNENENPIKENDHACFTKDAKIEIPIGEQLYQVSTGFKDVYEFMGSKVTKDHPYLTQRGFVNLDSLRYSDTLVVWKNKLLMGLSLDGTQTQTGVNLKTILYLLQRNVQASRLNVFTDIYGKNITVKFLKAFISIIKTTIHLITIYLISNVFHLKNIVMNTMKLIYQDLKNKWSTLENMQSSGIKVTRQRIFIENLVKYLGLVNLLLKEIVISVGKNMKPRSQQGVNSATIIAKLKHCGKEEVFATTTTSGFFVVNGIVVSNCDALRYALYMDEPVDVRFVEMQNQRILSNRANRHSWE